MIISLFTILPPEAFAAQAITINNHHWDSSDKTAVSDPVSITEYTELSRRTSNKLASGYYTVKSDTTVTDRLHIANGETVGIYLGANATLTSYGSSGGVGANSFDFNLDSMM